MTQLKDLNLLFPQWQGSGNSKGLFYGAKMIADHFRTRLNFNEVPVNAQSTNEIQNGIYAYSAITEQLQKACHILESTNPNRILTIGGDCGVELAPVSFLNQQYSKDLAVIWFDAHGDLNIPEDSLSHHFHGMPLRSLLGDGNKKIIDSCFTNISPKQVILVGGRDYDPAEKEFLLEKTIQNFSVSQLTRESESLVKLIQSHGFKNLYIHIDLDVLDPDCFPYVNYPSKNGLSLETLIKTISTLKNSFTIAGFSIVEFSPDGNSGLADIGELLETSGFL